MRKKLMIKNGRNSIGACQTLVKKIDVFSTEKNGDKWHKMALFSALTLALNAGSWAVQGLVDVQGSWANIQR